MFYANEFDPFGSSVLNEALSARLWRNLTTHSGNAAAGETHVFSPAAVNEFRFGWLRVSGGQRDPNAGNPFASTYGLAGTTANQRDMGFPQISLSNQFTTIGDAAGFTSRIDRNFELYDNVSIQHGQHSLKFGGYFFHLSSIRSIRTMRAACIPTAALIPGMPWPISCWDILRRRRWALAKARKTRDTELGPLYGEDAWQATPNLTLNFGLRYEFNQNLTARPNQTSNIDLAAPGGPAFVVPGNPAGLPARPPRSRR